MTADTQNKCTTWDKACDLWGLSVALECVEYSTQSEQLKEKARCAITSVMQRLAEEVTYAAEDWERADKRANEAGLKQHRQTA